MCSLKPYTCGAASPDVPLSCWDLSYVQDLAVTCFSLPPCLALSPGPPGVPAHVCGFVAGVLATVDPFGQKQKGDEGTYGLVTIDGILKGSERWL